MAYTTPGHTLDHLSYFSFHQNEPLLFCGDTLFSGGCGRLFEGTPDQMHNSLSKLAALPKHTKVFCTHEYTESNLNFAAEVEPNNQILKEEAESINELDLSDPTGGSTIGPLDDLSGIENFINPLKLLLLLQ